MRSIVWLGSGMAALLLAFAAIVGWRGTVPPSRPAAPAAVALPAQPVPAAPAATAPQTSAPATMPAAAPSFDVVRIDPQGQAVIAGRAAPGDRVRVLDGDRPIGEVTADARGEWVLLPDAPIAPGNRQLSLEATGRDGGPARRSGDVVALSVLPPPSGTNGASAVAVLLPGDADKPARVLQQQLREGGALGLEGVEQTGGALAITGYAGAGARVNIYAGDRLLGTAVADRVGQWTLSAPYRLPPGGVQLRVEELAGDGAVLRHITAPLTPLPVPAHADTYVVERGNSLWLIARQVYGQGLRYTAIYRANHDLIRDPNRIYPGQQFKLPKS
jgi:hypothetical protein